MANKGIIKTLEKKVNLQLNKRRLSDLTTYIEIEPNKYVILSKGLKGDREYFDLGLGITPEEIGLKYYTLKELQAQYNEYNSFNLTEIFRESCNELDKFMGN